MTPAFDSPYNGGHKRQKSRDVLLQEKGSQLEERYQARKMFLEDLDNYVAVGSLMMTLKGHDTFEQSTSSDEWLGFNTLSDHRLSSEELLESTENADGVCSWQTKIIIDELLALGWIRVFVKRCKMTMFATIRVYALPDDVGRRYIERNDAKVSLRMHFKQLLAKLDISRESWQGHPTISNNGWRTRAITDSLKNAECEGSLFYLFNTIAPPHPTRRKVACQFSQAAISSILDNSRKMKGLQTELYPYQKRSAAVMIQREVQPVHTLDPRLEAVEGPLGNTFYYDKESGILCRDGRTYEEARGGILGETMGFGKTLICLAVVLATKGHWPLVPPEYSLGRHPIRHRVGTLAEMAASAIGRAQIPWKSYFQDLAQAGEHYDGCIELLEKNIGSYIIPSPQEQRTRSPLTAPKGQTIRLCTATLIVVPLNLFTQWQNEIGTHVDEDTLSVFTVPSLDAPMPSEADLLRCDIILISKQRFEREMKPLELNPTTSKRKIQCVCSSMENCSCPAAGPSYYSPLRKFHFLRIIVDEGHQFASSGGTNNMIWALQRLHVDRRWIVSGTPSTGLIGAEITLAANETSSTIRVNNTTTNLEATGAHSDTASQTRISERLQEFKDLQKLGRIVVDFLGVRPWANTKVQDAASWQQYVLPTKEGIRKPRSLRGILESLVVRHRIEDIEKDIQLPALNNKVVYLKPSWHDKLSINLFLLNLIVNAVTSERCDEDYMFHPKNRSQLNKLIANLRQSGFYWTSVNPQDLAKSLEVSQKYLDQPAESVRFPSGRKTGDAEMLQQAIAIGQATLESPSWSAFALLHEIGLYVEHFPAVACESWSLLQSGYSEPLLVGATQLAKSQRFIDFHLYDDDLEQRLANEGQDVMQKSWREATIDNKPESNAQNFQVRRTKNKRVASSSSFTEEPKLLSKHTFSRGRVSASPPKPPRIAKNAPESLGGNALDTGKGLKSALKPSPESASAAQLPLGSPLAKTRLCGTASAKLSYLLDRIVNLQSEEKSLVFYEGDHIAYYIAQAFEILNIRFLIYTGSLEASRKNAYIYTFNTSEIFRVMLMDIKQAAHGLHVASASRVFFVNPIWQPNVEAQAIKRAHRIGQRRPVFVETLVLEDTLEHQMLERRKAMTAPEHIHAERSLVDDPIMSDLIKEASFIPITAQEVSDPRFQMAPLQQPQQVFGRMSMASMNMEDADTDLIFPRGNDCKAKQQKRKSSESAQYAPDMAFSPMSREKREQIAYDKDRLESPALERRISCSTNSLDNGSSITQFSPSLTAPGPVACGPSTVPHGAAKPRVSFKLDGPATDESAGIGVAAGGSSDLPSRKRVATGRLGGSSKRVAFAIDETAAQSNGDAMHHANQGTLLENSPPVQPRSLFGNASRLA